MKYISKNPEYTSSQLSVFLSHCTVHRAPDVFINMIAVYQVSSSIVELIVQTPSRLGIPV